MDGKDLSDPLNNVALIKDDQTRTTLGSSGDSEKVIQHLNDELRKAQEMANTEKHKYMELEATIEKERKEKKQVADESAKQIQVLQGQLQKLNEEVGSLREQQKGSSSLQDELQRAREEVKSLKHALDETKAECSTVSKDRDKWHQMANKYEHDVENLQSDLQQQSKQWQKTAEIQANELQSVQVECNGLQKECAALRSEKQETTNKLQKERATLQSDCATLKAEKEELLKSHQKEKANLQNECSALRSEKEAALEKQQQLEKDLTSSHAKNTELTNRLKNLDKSQEDLEKKLATIQLQHQEERAKLETQLEEANTRSDTLQRECDSAQVELSNSKDKYEKAEQQNQLLTEELRECKDNMKDIQEKGTKTSLLLPIQAIAIGLVLALLFWCFGALW